MNRNPSPQSSGFDYHLATANPPTVSECWVADVDMRSEAYVSGSEGAA